MLQRVTTGQISWTTGNQKPEKLAENETYVIDRINFFTQASMVKSLAAVWLTETELPALMTMLVNIAKTTILYLLGWSWDSTW